MRIALTVLLLGAALVAAPALVQMDAGVSALGTIALSVVLATLVSEYAGPFSIALGALGALAHAGIAPQSLSLAGAFLLLACYGARIVRAPTALWRGVHVLAALAAGGIAATIAVHFSHGSIAVRSAAILVSGIFAALPMMVPADDVIAWSLLGLAKELPEPSRASLLRAAFLRRRVSDDIETLSDKAVERLDHAWDVLVEVGRNRLVARGPSAEVIDTRIQRHVETLERIYNAAQERIARAADLDDKALAATTLESEQLEAEVSALSELEQSNVVAAPR